MRTAATRLDAEPASLTLSVAFELGNSEWRLACTPGLDHLPLVRTIAARAVASVEVELARAKAHFGLPAHAAVRSCYEAGRDGFWLHRYLRARGSRTTSSTPRASKSIAAPAAPRAIGSTRASW